MQYEYKVIRYGKALHSEKSISESLSQHAKDGWRVSKVVYADDSIGGSFYYTLERAVN